MGEDELEDEVELVRIYGPEMCPRPCSECGNSDHHWLELSVDPDDADDVAFFREEHPGLEPTEELLLAHYVCKHCPAVARPAEAAQSL